MEETTNKSDMSTGMIVGIAVIVAIIFGGGAYAYINNKAEKEKKDLNAQITELQSQVATSGTTATTTPTSSTSPTTATDETANWKTYTSSKYEYSFRYPTDWIVKDITSNNSHIAGLKSLIVATIGEQAGDSWYQVQITSNSLASEVDKVVSSANTNQELVSNTEIQKYGKSVTSVVLKNKTTQKTSTRYFVSNNSQTYMLTGPSSDSADANAVIGNKIVETFQFTN